ncbi:hypothetical protein, partial [Corynebacterium aquatimens]
PSTTDCQPNYPRYPIPAHPVPDTRPTGTKNRTRSLTPFISNTDFLPLVDPETNKVVANYIPPRSYGENGRIVVADEAKDLTGRGVKYTTKTSVGKGECGIRNQEVSYDFTVNGHVLDKQFATNAPLRIEFKPCQRNTYPRPVGSRPIPQLKCNAEVSNTTLQYIQNRKRNEMKRDEIIGSSFSITPGEVQTFKKVFFEIDLGKSDPGLAIDRTFAPELEFEINNRVFKDEFLEGSETAAWWLNVPPAYWAYPNEEIIEKVRAYASEVSPTNDDPFLTSDSNTHKVNVFYADLIKEYIQNELLDGPVKFDQDRKLITFAFDDENGFLSAPKNALGEPFAQYGSDRSDGLDIKFSLKSKEGTVWAPYTGQQTYSIYTRYQTDTDEYKGECLQELSSLPESQLSGVAWGEPIKPVVPRVSGSLCVRL